MTFAETRTGVAYANPPPPRSSPSPHVTWRPGSPWAALASCWPRKAHGAANIGPLPKLSSFTGSVPITSTVPIVSLSLNAEAFPVFSSLPPGHLPDGTPLATGH